MSSRRIGEFARRIKRTNEAGEDLEPLSVTKSSGVVLQSEKYNKRVATDPHKYVIAHDGDFAFDPMSLYYGAIGRVKGIGRGLVSPDYVTFAADRTVDHDFLERLLRYTEMHKRYESLSETGNSFGKRRRLYWSVFKMIDLLLPPLPEQRKIAAILSSVDDAIEATQAVIDQLQVVKKAMMAELLTRGLPGRHTRFMQTEIGEVPVGWEVRHLVDVARIVAGAAFPRERQLGRVGQIPFVKCSDMNLRGCERLQRDAEQWVTEGTLQELRAKAHPAGTTIFPKVGASLLTNKRRLLVRPTAFDNNVMGATPFGVHAEFFFYWFQTVDFASLVQPGAVPSVNAGLVGSLPVPIPPPEEAAAIASALDSVDLRLESEMGYVGGLGALKSALLSVLLTGEVRVTPDPEPA